MCLKLIDNKVVLHGGTITACSPYSWVYSDDIQIEDKIILLIQIGELFFFQYLLVSCTVSVTHLTVTSVLAVIKLAVPPCNLVSLS